MFIELITNKGEKITFNTQNIVLVTPDRKGTVLVDVNGMDWVVTESYESLKGVLQTYGDDNIVPPSDETPEESIPFGGVLTLTKPIK